MSDAVIEKLVEEVVALRLRVGALERLEQPVYGQGARVYNSANITLEHDKSPALSFDTVRWNNDGCWTSSSPTRLTCRTPGIYVISGHVSFAANATGRRVLYIRLNSDRHIAIASQPPVPAVSTYMSITTVYSLDARDYLHLLALQNSGGALDVIATGNHSPEFAMVRVG